MIRSLIAVTLVFLIFGCDNLSNRPEEFGAIYDSTQYDRVSMNYEIYGHQDTVLIFIHGWNLNLRYWDNQVKHFKNRYRILTLDLAGHGNSGRDRINWTAESFARDITTIMAKESINKAIIVGHSMGGEVALQIMDAVPQKIIQIIGVDCFKDPSFELTEEFKLRFREHFQKFKRDYHAMADNLARQNIRTKNRDVINRIVKDYRDADPKIALAIYRNLIPKYAEEKEKLQRLPFKLNIIGSDYSPFNEDALTQYTTRFGYEIFPVYKAGHFPMVEEPEQFNQIMDTVLARITVINE